MRLLRSVLVPGPTRLASAQAHRRLATSRAPLCKQLRSRLRVRTERHSSACVVLARCLSAGSFTRMLRCRCDASAVQQQHNQKKTPVSTSRTGMRHIGHRRGWPSARAHSAPLQSAACLQGSSTEEGRASRHTTHVVPDFVAVSAGAADVDVDAAGADAQLGTDIVLGGGAPAAGVCRMRRCAAAMPRGSASSKRSSSAHSQAHIAARRARACGSAAAAASGRTANGGAAVGDTRAAKAGTARGGGTGGAPARSMVRMVSHSATSSGVRPLCTRQGHARR
jgi:hypothetical protein